MGKPPTIQARLRWHRLFDGMFTRIAKQFRVDPSFVYRIAHGQRNSEKIMQALDAEMKRLEKLKPK